MLELRDHLVEMATREDLLLFFARVLLTLPLQQVFELLALLRQTSDVVIGHFQLFMEVIVNGRKLHNPVILQEIIYLLLLELQLGVAGV